MPYLVTRGAFCRVVDFAFVEFHTWGPPDKEWVSVIRVWELQIDVRIVLSNCQ